MLDWRPRGRGFEPHQRHYVVSLSKNINPSLVLVHPRKTRPLMTESLLIGCKESNQINKTNMAMYPLEPLYRVYAPNRATMFHRATQSNIASVFNCVAVGLRVLYSQCIPLSFMITEIPIYHNMTSRLEVMSCNKIDKLLVIYSFSGNVMTSITTLRT